MKLKVINLIDDNVDLKFCSREEVKIVKRQHLRRGRGSRHMELET